MALGHIIAQPYYLIIVYISWPLRSYFDTIGTIDKFYKSLNRLIGNEQAKHIEGTPTMTATQGKCKERKLVNPVPAGEARGSVADPI